MSESSMLFNFSWVVEGVIAGSSIPYNTRQFDFLRDEGIKVIINLTGESYHIAEKLSQFTLYNLPIQDFSIPSKSTLVRFWEICQKHEKAKEPILVHCIAGCGRTGTMLAVWLFQKRLVDTTSDAIERIRLLRPCSIETEEQENLLRSIDLFL